MAHALIVKSGDCIVSPLGVGTAENFAAVRAGRSALRPYAERWPGVEPFVASLFDATLSDLPAAAGAGAAAGLTRFERLALLAATRAIADSGIDPSGADVLFILSSTKGNVEILDGAEATPALLERSLLPTSALRLAARFGNPNTPVVVSNACISGLAALITAARLLRLGRYRHTVVVGADSQSRFIVSGFQSFKALSPQPCRPFDALRDGLNAGEAAAAVVLSRKDTARVAPGEWVVDHGAIRNDANHISGPSRTGEGSLRALRAALADRPAASLAFVNAHGTATPYNDEMEAIAIDRAGLSALPVNSLKGYYGHTMGAAGILEVLLSMQAVAHGVVLPTRGFSRLGVSRPVRLSAAEGATDRHAFLKLMSGFGGCNAALRLTQEPLPPEPAAAAPAATCRRTVRIDSDGTVRVGEVTQRYAEQGSALLTAIYRREVNDYPKFFKMDPLCRLGFVASELLLRDEPDRFRPREDRAVVLFSRCGSLCNDLRYLRTVQWPDAYFPSPAVFVYTLANIVTGEIAIRNHFYGETSCFLLPSDEPATEAALLDAAWTDPTTRSLVCGWIDCPEADRFTARLQLLQRNDAP